MSPQEETTMQFRDRLEQAIKYSGMNAAELSKKSGIAPSEISRYRQGKYEPKLPKLYALSVALNVSPSWLMGFDIDENEDRLDQALTSLWSSLTDEQKSQALAYMQFLIANQTSNI
jgi:transcriptional regulator with XRE-family HTH domain